MINFTTECRPDVPYGVTGRDDIMHIIAQTNEFPYIHEYLLTNLSVGEHTLKEVWITYDENWNKKMETSTTETITITK